MKRLRVGVIGCGVMGSFHIKQYASIPEVELIGVYDIDPARVPQGYKFYSDFNGLLAAADAVSITSPTSTHYEMAVKAIEMGKHLLVEKPIAVSSEQGRDIVSRAKAKGVVLAVGHIERFNPAFIALVRSMGKNRPELIDIKRFSPLPARITDASCVIDMTIHDIDLAIKLAGSKVKHVHASGRIISTQKLDTAYSVIIFENGTVANIETSRVHGEKVRTVIVASGEAMFEADLLNKKLNEIYKGRKKEIATSQHDQLNAELRDFISAVLKRKQPLVTGEDGLAALDVANKIEELAKT